MRADTGLDQPFARVLTGEVGQRAVFVGRFGRAEVRVARILVDKIGNRNGARLGDLLFGAVADEDGFAEEEHGQLRARAQRPRCRRASGWRPEHRPTGSSG
jgi:hypothetical protein